MIHYLKNIVLRNKNNFIIKNEMCRFFQRYVKSDEKRDHKATEQNLTGVAIDAELAIEKTI